MKIASDDEKFLQALGGGWQAGSAWKVLQRKGSILLLMPSRGDSIRAGAKLYSPQTKLAKLVTSVILRGLGWRMLSGIDWEWRTGSPLEALLKIVGAPVGAILLGNPTAPGRRALVLTDEERPRVLKIGAGDRAMDLVRREKKFLKSFGGQTPLIPEMIVDCGGENWEAFGVSYFENGGEVSLDTISVVLQGWLAEEARPMSRLPGWQQIADSSHPAATPIAEATRSLVLKPSIVHGDLAPWNIRGTPEGEMVFIDWENARAADVPCWDALHFVFQQAALVKRLGSLEIEEEVKTAMKKGELERLIQLSGWAGHEDLLFSSYLLGMATEDFHVDALLDQARNKSRII